jgi:hypothetical protein
MIPSQRKGKKVSLKVLLLLRDTKIVLRIFASKMSPIKFYAQSVLIEDF